MILTRYPRAERRLATSVLTVCILALAACDRDVSAPLVQAGDAAVADVPLPPITDPVLLAVAARLPADWAGTGTLEETADLPDGAPAWAKARAEVVDEEGHRYLRTTGVAKRISNASLAGNAAAGRARAVMAAWLGTDVLRGSEVVQRWNVPKSVSIAQAQLEVPATWQPGQPLPEPEDAAQSDSPTDSGAPQ